MKPRPEASLLTATRKQQTELTQSETPPTIIIDSITVLSCKRTRSINHFTPRSLLSKAELQPERYNVMRCYTKKTRSLVEMNENVFNENVCHLVPVAIFGFLSNNFPIDVIQSKIAMTRPN